MPADDTRLSALTVDVEDYFQVEAFAKQVAFESWSQFPSRVADNTRRVLELFAALEVHATMFIVGWVAEREPALVREMAAAGHEIACHSYRHRHICRLSPQEFREDTRRAIRTLEDAGGRKVAGYRAPTFSIMKESLWALEILADEGITYDASVFPVRHDLYGIPDAPRFPFTWRLPSGRSLDEFPATTARLGGMNLATGGGGYLRILPLWYTRWALDRVRRHDDRPAMVYFHPWEIDPGQPRIPTRWKSRLRQYSNLRSMEQRVRAVVQQGRFAPMRDVLAQEKARAPLPIVPATLAKSAAVSA
jgi:polysaccharide deacetylase family protein (PEP-CTERM system associated)